jgi:hypothetical protein
VIFENHLGTGRQGTELRLQVTYPPRRLRALPVVGELIIDCVIQTHSDTVPMCVQATVNTLMDALLQSKQYQSGNATIRAQLKVAHFITMVIR